MAGQTLDEEDREMIRDGTRVLYQANAKTEAKKPSLVFFPPFLQSWRSGEDIVSLVGDVEEEVLLGV